MEWKRFFTVVILASELAGCGTSIVAPLPVLRSIDVTPTTGSYTVPATEQFTAIGRYSDGSTKDITQTVSWTSSDSTVATISNAAGSQGMARMVGAGSSNIEAAWRTAKGSAAIIVTSNLTSIDVTPTGGSYQLSAMQQFTATGRYNDGSGKDITELVTWSSSNTMVATISNGSGSQGMVTMVGSGSASIIAAVGAVQGSSSIIVTSPVSVSVAPSFASVTVTHQTKTFSAIVQGSTNTAVTWSVDGVDGGNSAVGMISSGGFYTPPGTKGFHTITATSQVDTGKSASAQVAVSDNPGIFTRNYDNARTSLNPDEIVLTPQTVNVNQFGKLFSYSVDGRMYAQPLYVANVNVPGKGYHNVLYAATINDSVYAFDADDPLVGIIWTKRLVDNSVGETPVPCAEETEACSFYGPEIGITGTPVIDLQTGTMFVSAFSEINGTYFHKLHALEIATGKEKPGSPVTIQGSIPGTGQGGDGTTVTFDPYYHLQRPGLMLANGLVYVGFASYGDEPPFHGWLFAYDSQSFNRVAIFNATPNGAAGGIWQSGAGPAADALGNIYLITGNGDFNANLTEGRDYGDSFIKLSPQLDVLDYFTPYNEALLDVNDLDLGSGGPVLLPDQSGAYPHLLIGGSKEGIFYLLNRDNLGKYNSTDNNQVVQSISGQSGNPAYVSSNFAFWNGNLYFEGFNSVLKMFRINNGVVSVTPVSEGQYVGNPPGLTPAVSANQAQGGIVWTIESSTPNSNPGVLRAYDATDLSIELYDSNESADGRDFPGPVDKFQIPTVVNGKAYVPTNTELDVYGLLP